MPNHFEDRHAGEVYDLNGAAVVLIRQHAANWGHTWIVRYIEDEPGRLFAIEPGGLDMLGWELLGHVRGGSFVALTARRAKTGASCERTRGTLRLGVDPRVPRERRDTPGAPEPIPSDAEALAARLDADRKQRGGRIRLACLVGAAAVLGACSPARTVACGVNGGPVTFADGSSRDAWWVVGDSARALFTSQDAALEASVRMCGRRVLVRQTEDDQ